MNIFCYFGENGLVSRFNSGDLAGKCADFNSQQKIALRAENNCLSRSHFRSFPIFRAFRLFFREFSELYLGPDGFSARSAIFCCLLEVAIFRQLGTAIDASAAAIFT